MSEIYKIKEKHPIKEFIRQEIIDIYGNEKYDNIGIDISSIDDSSICSSELYGFRFNRYNMDVPCMNVALFLTPTVDNPPSIIPKDKGGYDYYSTSTNCTIKLKTFLEKNPEWTNLKKWTTTVKQKREKCEYDGHNSDNRTASIRRPDGKKYIVDFPDDVESDDSVLDWIKPMEKQLTKRYYRNISFDKLNNIKRNLEVWVEGLVFVYDYKDGVVEIRDIIEYKSSVYKTLKKSKIIDIKFGLPEETKEMIKKEIQSRDLEVKDIILGEYKPEKTRIKVES